MYLAYVTGAGEAKALSFGLQALSTTSKTRVYGEPVSGPAGSTQELEIQKDQEIIFNNPENVNHPGGKQTL